ncbi:YceI family protein [Kribbella sp. NPDC026611]|uniref:YceI family protein n=1 Tax=Kribbella sp. NPDC026611 TaxID=3154911 RepID=UPI0033E89B95
MTNDYFLDASRTRLAFTARHRLGTRVRGHFSSFEGTAHLNRTDPPASTAWLTVRTDSISTGNNRRDAQLRKDFLRVSEHPAMTFVSTDVAQLDTSSYELTGDLTIRGVTRPLAVPVVLTDPDAFTARLTINRHRWQVNWNAFTTALVCPEIDLDLQFTLAPQSSHPTPSPSASSR